MYFMVAIMTASLIGVVALGVYLEYRPSLRKRHVAYVRGAVLGNLVLFFVAQAALLFLGVQDALAQPVNAGGAGADVTLGFGLALLGAGIPTGLATIGAGIAVAPVGSAAMALISEKPEMFGRTLVYLGLAEGIAIYGLVVSILILGRL